MFDIIELNGKKVAELRQIATKLGISRTDKLKKQDLVYSILDEQAAQPSKQQKATSGSKESSGSRPRRGRGKEANAAQSDDKSEGDNVKRKRADSSDGKANSGESKESSEQTPDDNDQNRRSGESMRDRRDLSLIHI